MFSLNFVALGNNGVPYCDEVACFTTVEATVWAALDGWWEELKGPHLYFVLQGKDVRATLTSGSPTMIKDKNQVSAFTGIVSVCVRPDDGPWQQRMYVVTYNLDFDKVSVNTDVKLLN